MSLIPFIKDAFFMFLGNNIKKDKFIILSFLMEVIISEKSID